MSHLISDIETFREYVKVNVNTNISVLTPSIAEAERRYIIPLISKGLYDDLLAYVDGSDESNETFNELLEQVQIPLANLAFWLYIPSGNVMIDDAGIHVLKNDNYSPASQFRIEDLKESVATAGFDALDNLLEFFEENKDEFADWTASDSYTIFHELMLSTAKEFSKHYNINNSRRTFLAIRHIIKHVQETFVKKVLGDELYEELLEQLTSDGSDTISTENETLLRYIHPAIAYLTIADATIELPLEFRGNGIIINAMDSTMENALTRTPAESTRLQTICTKAKEKGSDYLKRLDTWLKANAGDYPLYVVPDETDNTYFENKSTRKGYFT